MMKKVAVLITALIVTLAPITLCAQGGSSGVYDITKESIEITAPDFTLPDLDGKAHELSGYNGKTVLLIFTTTWCPYCIKEIPDLKKMFKEYQGKDFELIAVYIQESKKKVAAFAQKYDLPYTILLDPDGRVAQTYGVRGVPTKVLVSKKGTILCWSCRSLDTLLEQELGTP